MARPKKYDIDEEQVQNLARFGCTNIEIADYFGCDESLIRHSYSEFLIKGRAEQKLRLRQLQFKACEKGNATMLIWLGKQMLGQRDNDYNININEEKLNELSRLFAQEVVSTTNGSYVPPPDKEILVGE